MREGYNKEDVSVIIVNYKTSGLIIDCVKSIIDLTQGIDYEVIIVDNNSEPDFERIIREGASIPTEKNFKFLALPENIGFGRANNEGIKIAQGRNILFLNPDTLLLNNAIKILSDFLDTHPKAGACGGNMYDNEGNPNFSFWRLFPGIIFELDSILKNIPSKLIYGNNITFNNTNIPIKVAYIIGADLMVKRILLKKTNGFQKDYFMFCEETDLCLRIKKFNYNIFSVPEAKIIHLEGRSFVSNNNLSEKRMKYIEESRRIYQKHHQSKFSSLISNFIFLINLIIRIGIEKDIKKKNSLKRRKKLLLSKVIN